MYGDRFRTWPAAASARSSGGRFRRRLPRWMHPTASRLLTSKPATF